MNTSIRYRTILLLATTAWAGCADLTNITNTTVPAKTTVSMDETGRCSESMRLIGLDRTIALGKPSKPNSQTVDAIYWCTKAAGSGDVTAQIGLARIYEHGVGTPVNKSEALRWYKAAGSKGNPEAQFKVGLMYGRGEGIPVDKLEATRWYQKAAEGGLADAQYYMGYRYEHGKGITQDFINAAKWYSRAAEQGNISSMDGLGSLYLDGHGVPQSLVEAYKWFNLAAVSGEQTLISKRDKLAGKLTANQLAEGQKLASDWARTHRVGKQLTQ
jgi:TPR repeat protein